MMAEVFFWLTLVLILYVYIGYPIAIFLGSLLVRREVKQDVIEPHVTVLITAYNEEKSIGEKIEDTLLLDYPSEKLEILVASDGSTDGTDDIVQGFADRNVRLIRVEGRVGKTETQNVAVGEARGDIIVFSDATTKYRRGAIRNLVRNYHDSTVGAVSGRYEYVNPSGAPVGFGTMLFWKYENFIKTRQTRIRTITGCCGCIYSVRRVLYVPLPRDIISDLVEPLKILEQGYRIAFEKDAVAYEETEEKVEDEFSMRVRVITRGMNGLLFARNLLNPARYPIVAFQLISHKILRWGIPFLLLLLFVSSGALIGRPLYTIAFMGQLGLYLAALLAWVLEGRGKKAGFLFVPLYFTVVNLAAARAFLNLVVGRKMTVWETRR